jgi:transcription elongation GreA/GreB family factor
MTKVPMTVRGAELLREELAKLKSEDRPTVIKAIAEARAHGDLKENAEYHAAKDQQGFIEARIKQIEAKLSNTQIVDVTTIDAKGRIVFGATVDLLDVQSDQKSTYKIRTDFVYVADSESDDRQEQGRRNFFFGTGRREALRGDRSSICVGARPQSSCIDGPRVIGG